MTNWPSVPLEWCGSTAFFTAFDERAPSPMPQEARRPCLPAPQPVLAHEHASKAMPGAAITADLLDQGHAARLMARAAKTVGGGTGAIASAGGRHPERLEQALASRGRRHPRLSPAGRG